MSETLLSQSLIQTSEDSQGLRDPFQSARNQYESRKSSTVLSSSPLSSGVSAPVEQAPEDFAPSFQKLGIDTQGVAMTEIGKMQLVGRLRDKYGENYAQNPEALSALEAFDKQLKFLGPKAQKGMNETMSNAERTLGALLKGQ